MHRIGRTGRAGRTGDAISFITPRERHLLKADRAGHPPAADADAAAHRRGRQRDPGRAGSATRSPRRSARTRSAFYRDLIADYEQRARRPGRRHRRRAGRADPGRPAAADGSPSPSRAPHASSTASARRGRRLGPREGPPPRPTTTGPGAATAGPRRGRSDVPMATYRIAVGKRHKVEPRQIVGAIANEGGLDRGGLRAHRHPRRPLARRAAGRPVRRRPARRWSAPGSRAS